MYPVQLTFSNWILAWYILYKLKLVKSVPAVTCVFATIVFTVLFHRKLSGQLFWLYFALHVIIPIDLLLVERRSITRHLASNDSAHELMLLMIYNVYILLMFDKTFVDVYFKDLPYIFSKYPNMTVAEFFMKVREGVSKV